ncbi:MAG: tetraacyldisaccharide 4'-kinase [Thermoanaerobaculia bacterium]
MSALLKPAELAYRGVNRLRRALYRNGVLKARRLPRPVVSVGNIAIGGGGKTPAVIAIARLLVDAGIRPAVLTRGYGRQSHDPWLIVDGPDASRFGDEPIVIASAVPGLDVIVGADRFASGTAYLAQHDCDLFLLDDGFQHLQLARDIDIVLDQPRARLLREGRGALRAADFVIARVPPGAQAEGFTATLRPEAVVKDGAVTPVDTLRGTRVFAFSGLADNGQFFEMLRALGVELAGTREFPDHHKYATADLAEVRAAAGGALAITTEKDGVKIGNAGIARLRVAMDIEPRDAFKAQLLARITPLLRKL